MPIKRGQDGKLRGLSFKGVRSVGGKRGCLEVPYTSNPNKTNNVTLEDLDKQLKHIKVLMQELKDYVQQLKGV